MSLLNLSRVLVFGTTPMEGHLNERSFEANTSTAEPTITQKPSALLKVLRVLQGVFSRTGTKVAPPKHEEVGLGESDNKKGNKPNNMIRREAESLPAGGNQGGSSKSSSLKVSHI
jgi:hypothetical protein